MKKWSHIICFVMSALSCISYGVVVQAKEAIPTELVVGHKPTVDNVIIDNPTPTLGDTLTVNYDYNDVDGDAEFEPAVKWLYNGTAVAGVNFLSYTPVLNINTGVGNACTDFEVAAEVTPQSLTGDPQTGMAKQSSPVTVNIPTIPGFTFPSTGLQNWSNANNFCKGQGMQLPTRAQLQDAFKTYTSGGTNYHMSVKYGWPLIGGRCGGSDFSYWTRDDNGTGHHFVAFMHNGNSGGVPDNYSAHVTCVPPGGNAPVASNVSIFHSGNPTVGEEVIAHWDYADSDGDRQRGSQLEWLLNDTVVSTTTANSGDSSQVLNTYTLPSNAQGKTLKVRVTPRSATGIPSEGSAVTSKGVQVLGRAPVATNVTLSPANPKATQQVTVSWTYSDADNDRESGSTIAWYLNGSVVSGQTGATYTLPADSAGKTVQARITPRSAAPANPAVGSVASSASVTIAVNQTWPGNFTKPEVQDLDWHHARDYCKSLNANLPTTEQLQNLFLSSTSGGRNFEMCTKHGWPMGPESVCGGSTSAYWTREPSVTDGYYNIVWMTNGREGSQISSGIDRRPAQVTCVR